jgi:hypothetical protein
MCRSSHHLRQCLRRFAKEPGGRPKQDSTFVPRVGLFLATVIHGWHENTVLGDRKILHSAQVTFRPTKSSLRRSSDTGWLGRNRDVARVLVLGCLVADNIPHQCRHHISREPHIERRSQHTRSVVSSVGISVREFSLRIQYFLLLFFCDGDAGNFFWRLVVGCVDISYCDITMVVDLV